MTIIKQKAVVSERHAENVRKYLNSKDAVLRDGWNMEYHDKWFAEMARTRAENGHDIVSRNGTKNTLMYHQVLAFLPEECSVNGGKMTPELCMAFAMEYVGERYPDQQVVFALHEESDEAGKRYAVHMAINRTNLMTHKRLCEGTGKKGHHDRVESVRRMDDAWGLQQVEEGKPNSLIRNRNPRDAERAIIEDDRYSYKNNLRRIVKAVLRMPSVRSLDDFTERMQGYGVEIELGKRTIYATDTDVRDMGNPKCTFNLGRMDGNFTLAQVRTALAGKSIQAPKPSADPKSDYFERLDKTLAAYRDMAAEMGADTPRLKVQKRPDDLIGDDSVNDKILSVMRAADKVRSRVGAVKATGEQTRPGHNTGKGGSAGSRSRVQSKSHSRSQSRSHTRSGNADR